MAQLWDLGVRGTPLDVVAAWKEGLLLVALIVVAWHVRRLPAVKAADVLAATYAVVIIVYWLLPQDWLGGGATTRGELLALRHHLFPVAAYALGRLVSMMWTERGRMGGLIVLVAVVLAVVGLVDLAFISLQAWRDSGVPGWSHHPTQQPAGQPTHQENQAIDYPAHHQITKNQPQDKL